MATRISVCKYIDLKATGNNIIKLCDERNITVHDLKVAMGFKSVQAIYKWRTGIGGLSLDSLYVLSNLLDVSMEEIIVPKEDIDLILPLTNHI